MTSVVILSDNGVSSGTSGLKTSGGNDGTLALQSTNSAGTALTGLTIDNNQNVTLPNSLSSVNTFGFKNRLINGAMNIWQRGTSFTNSANSNQYTADRWAIFSGVGTVAVVSQASSGLQNYPYALRVQRQAANTGTAGCYAIQVIETANCRDLAGQSVTLSFQARAGANYSSSGNTLTAYVVTGSGTDQGLTNAINSSWTSQASVTQNFTLTTSFQAFTFTTTIPSGTNEIAIYIASIGVGTAGANDYFDIVSVQLEKGTQATSFDFRSIGTELALCQRYYQQWGGNSGNERLATGFNYGSAQMRATIPLVVTMRTAPTLTYSAVGDWAVEAATGTYTCTIIALDQASTKIAATNFNVSSGLTVGQGSQIMANATSNARFNLSAEL
jgi:hypothetical protein